MPDRDLHRLFRFCFVGAAVFCIDFSLLWLFLVVLPPMGAVSLAYLLAVMSHFFLTKIWVFEAVHPVSRREIAGYLIVVAASWACTAGVAWTSLRLLSDNVYIAKALAIPPTTLVSFVLMKRLAFRASHAAGPSEST